MLKRVVSMVLASSVAFAAAAEATLVEKAAETLEISNRYIKVVVNRKNGGYVISTVDGDILKKSDDNAALTHRGENFDTSFTSFKIDSDEYVFGTEYGFFGSETSDVVTEVTPDGNCIRSTWSIGDICAEQKISLVNNDASEQLGTAMLSYTVKNNGSSAKNIKSRILIDNQLGTKDYGYYEVPKQNLGQGYEYFEFERTWDSYADPSIRMPSDYFVRDNPYSSDIVGFGVNSVFTEQKPYKMTFAHWANIASAVFDYTPDEKLNFTNNLNEKKTADSAAALYYDLGNVAPGAEKTFSTYYGVTANLKNKDNRIIINTTAPSRLEFKDDAHTAYAGSEGEDNVVRINTTLTNPQYAKKDYGHLAVAVYALGFETQRQTDSGEWIVYDNADPVYTDIIDFKTGENRVTYFDFKFAPKNRAQLGTFVVKVFDMDESVNELGSYAEEFCLGTSENHIILPGRDADLPMITLSGLSPDIIYNHDIRYITVTGRGMEFFKSDLLNKIELRGDNGKNYEIPIENLVYEQGTKPTSISMMLEEYMESGRYQLHFIWKSDTGEQALDGVPPDFTSDGMVVQVSGDIRYYNACYGIVTVQRAEKNKYTVVPYRSEAEFENAKISEEKLLLTFRGDILQDRNNKKFYRLYGKDKDININYILNYHGDDLTIEEKSDGTAEILMDGKITTVGANTTVRNGTAAFRLKGGTEYIVPEYSADGEVEKNGNLSAGQDYIMLKWDNAFDVLTTVGGFLIDMKYGVLGKIKNDDETMSDIISFGGSLDLGFMTPGGAATARKNTAAGAKWTTKGTELNYGDDDDGYSFGLTFDENEGIFKSQVAEKDIEPANKDMSRVEAGAAIHDILYGGKNPGYIGINMDAHVSFPQLVKFLPNQIEGDLSINTIGGYKVGANAEVETASISMALSFVVKASPSGAPIPDKLYFTIGGFEPGINVDGLGVLWVTGGGGGFDNLYDTIYGKDGVPPMTLLLHVEFDITKILTGNADLELSLRSLKISFDDLSLKMLKDAKFVDGGEVAVGWYPNFNMNLSAGVNFAQIMQGRFTITAAAGKDTADFVQFVLYVAIGLPKYIPIVGGMELASAELGGGSQKMWGSVEVLSLIKVGFTYYWGGDIEFTHGSSGGGQSFAALSAEDDEGVRRAKQVYNAMRAPVQVGTDPIDAEAQFASVGGNLSYSAGSTAVADFEQKALRAMNPTVQLLSLNGTETEIFTNNERTSHLVSFGEACDYILAVSRADGKEISETDIKTGMKIRQGGREYGLNFYQAPAHNADDSQKREALKKANVNITNNTLYIAIPKADCAKDLLIEFGDGNAYDVSAIKVNPLPEITSCNAVAEGGVIKVNWDGKNISDTAKIIVSASDGSDEGGVVLNETEISAKTKNAKVAIPDKMASGEYSIKLTLSDEDICFEEYDAGKVTIVNPKAPGSAEEVVMENCGDDKLKISVKTKTDDFDGFMVEVLEDGKPAEVGLYFGKDEEIVVGGRYDVPVMDENGQPTGKSITTGYTPGRQYSAKVRLCRIEDPNPDTDGDEIYHCSAYRVSQNVQLIEATKPKIAIAYDKNKKAVKIVSDVAVCGELYINSGTENGEWYNFADKSTEFLQTVSLPDGEYTLEFYAEDSEGDHAAVQEIISIDTIPPVLMLAAPMSGGGFGGESIAVNAYADADAEYSFKINGNIVLPKESNIFDGTMMKCTLPLENEKDAAKINMEITATDKAGNETVKNILLWNNNLSKIKSIYISNTEEKPIDGKIVLDEGNTAELKVYGVLENGKKMDITQNQGVSLDVQGGTSAKLDGTNVTADFVGRTFVSARFDLGGNDALHDGVVIETADKTLIYSALEETLAAAEKMQKEGYTDESRQKLENAIDGARQILSAQGVTQDDIDSAQTALAEAMAGLTVRDSAASRGNAAQYTVLFNTNGGSTIASQKVKSGMKVTAPEEPTKDGYIFDGWYIDKKLTQKYDFDDSVTRSFTLFAKWVKNDANEWINPFDDVKADDWFYDYVRYSVENGLFNGVTETTFAPGGLLTRAMLMTVLWRCEGKPMTDYIMPFADVGADSYYAEALRWAASENIVNGVSESEFAPNKNITREQIAAIMYRYASYKGYDVSVAESTDILSYSDYEQISEYAVAAMCYAVGSGLMEGRTDSTINPKDNATRAETAAVMKRFLEINR